MKYASVIVPLVLVGVLFVIGCIWVAVRKDKDEGDEESVPELVEPAPKGPKPPHLAIPVAAHTIPPLDLATHSSSSHSLSVGHDPPRYER
ncbi:putative transmembrane protein [Rhizoctonia solani 123E]|uniref:Putative transmembrane protein n=1 Tax=Rhizoctonia solani 123E TaxID=1423351 RepID=A0A074RRU6_9AGAM|nr:putative transmembrane protein [Rhizoctonia solani 123E]